MAYLGLGANIGDAESQMCCAVRKLGNLEASRLCRVSSLYLSEPVGIVDQPAFLNAVVEIETSLSPFDLLDSCLAIEESMGRRRTVRWGPRVIDIDLLVYDSVNMKTAKLTLPHPRIGERAFVLAPLAELAPTIELSAGVTVQARLAAVGSRGVRRIKGREWCAR